MNNSRTFAAVLSGLTLLAVSAVAQSTTTGSATGSRSGAATTRSGTSATTAPASTATSPSSETAPSSVSGSASATTTSGSMDNSSVNSSTNANSNSFGPGASQFKTLDTDADGRISRAEFTASGAAALNAEATASQDASATASTDTTKGEKKHWWSRRSSDKASDMDANDTFAKLDTDHDGFLSQSELASANAKLKK